MPCNDGLPPGWNHDLSHEIAVLKQKLRERDAMLCAVLTALSNGVAPQGYRVHANMSDVLDCVNWKESGTNRGSLEHWWHLHKMEDQKRRAAEAEAKRISDRRAEILATLSEEDKTILGLKPVRKRG